MASNLIVMASNLQVMASNLLAMAFNLIVIASKLQAMASILVAFDLPGFLLSQINCISNWILSACQARFAR